MKSTSNTELNKDNGNGTFGDIGYEILTDDGSSRDLDGSDSNKSSECCSSSESESEDDLKADDHNELCKTDNLHYDEDMQVHENGRHRMSILILSTLLAMLLSNFGYQLLRISRVSYSDSPPVNGVKSVAKNVAMDPNNKSHNQHEKKVRQNVGNDDTDNKKQNSKDNEEYRMPQHPARIYTHSSLSSKNYRAGGVLSDEMIHRFEDDGVLVIRNLVSPKLLDRIDLASHMLIDGQDEASRKTKRGKQFHMVKNGAIFLGVPQQKKETLCNTANEDETCEVEAERGDSDDNIVLSSFRDLAMYSKIPRVAASLLRLDELRVGGEQYLKLSRQQKMKQNEREETNHLADDSINLRICRDIFLTKDDGPYACGWHTDDTGFWPNVASDPGVNAWVALDDMPWPWAGKKSKNVPSSSKPSADSSSHDTHSNPVATFTLSLGSHRAPWRHKAYQVTGSTHTVPPEGYQSAADLVQRRSGSGTCNIQTSAPDLYEKLEENKVIYDLKKGDVIFHDRWVFHRTVTVSEYNNMAHGNPVQDQNAGGGKPQPASPSNKFFRRYSIRYAPGTAVVPPGYGVELSVLHDHDNANRTLDEIVQRSGPWYPKVWPHVLKKKPLQSPGKSSVDESEEEEIEGLSELVHEKIPKAEGQQKKRKKEIQRLLSMRGRP